MAIDVSGSSVFSWIRKQCLYRRNGTQIWLTDDPAWLVKESYKGREKEIGIESDFINYAVGDGPRVRNMVQVPAEPERRTGRGWYAMRAYDGTISDHHAFARQHWCSMAIHILDFLEDLHRGHQLVHMDIKRSNILVDKQHCKFIVADYELLHAPSQHELLCDCEDDYAWYFVEHGGELNELYASWRIDFVMLGYLLAWLTWDSNQNEDWTYPRACEARRKGRSPGTLTSREILSLREHEMSRSHPVVLHYLSRVAALVPWSEVQVLPVSVYDELRSVFR